MTRTHRIVMLSGLFTFTLAFVNSFRPEERKKHGTFPDPYHIRLFVGGCITYLVLSALADVEPKLAGPLAACIGTTAFVAYGAPVINYALGDLSNPSTGPISFVSNGKPLPTLTKTPPKGT